MPDVTLFCLLCTVPLVAVICQENWLFQIWHSAKISFLSILVFNPLNAELNLICHLLALLGVHHFLHVSRIRVNVLAGSSLPVIDMFVSMYQKWHAWRRNSYKLGIPLMSIMFVWNIHYTVVYMWKNLW